MEQLTTIKVDHLSKIYRLYDKNIDRLKEVLHPYKKLYHREHFALRNISFEVKQGETVGIIGVNGSGKSTLLKIITNVAEPSGGSVLVNGKISALLELGAGFNPDYSGLENIYLNGTMMGFSREEMKTKVSEILEFADIGDFINQPIKTYSSGMFARLAFAVAINVEPDILIVDEALSVGDARFQLKCMKKMQQMIGSGVTVLFVSHDYNTIKKFCNRCIWIDHGNIIADGDAESVTDSYVDFIKSGIIVSNNDFRAKDDAMPDFIMKDGIAEIVDFRVTNSLNKETSEVEIDEPVKVTVFYDVYDDTIKKPVLGVALQAIDDEYLCGLNTKLDGKNIPWEKGRNYYTIEYPNGLLLNGGNYYFDTGLFDETVIVRIHYIKAAKQIKIKPSYIAEGKFVLPHKWGCSEGKSMYEKI